VGIFVYVRGWMECDNQQLAQVERIIAAHDDDFYSRGWAISRQGWCNTVFYGGHLRAHLVDWLLAQVREIAAIPASDDDDVRVVGLLFASHEIDGMTEWRIHDGGVHLTSGDARYAYLDALPAGYLDALRAGSEPPPATPG
jgi:hypothetical protein